MSTLYLLNKPFHTLSQFTDDQGRATLADVIDVPDIYAAGRLDYDSEGLLLLTDDGALIQRISDPRHKQPKTYWVQVEGSADAAALRALREGLVLNDGPTRPAQRPHRPGRDQTRAHRFGGASPSPAALRRFARRTRGSPSTR